MHFLENDTRVTPLLTFDAAKAGGPGWETVVGWAVERKNGGRGFAYTEGHFHSHWQIESFRRLVLNGLLWTAHVEVPEGGVESVVAKE